MCPFTRTIWFNTWRWDSNTVWPATFNSPFKVIDNTLQYQIRFPWVQIILQSDIFDAVWVAVIDLDTSPDEWINKLNGLSPPDSSSLDPVT